MPAVIRFGLDNMIGSLRSRKQKLWLEWKERRKIPPSSMHMYELYSGSDDLEN